MQKKKEQKSQNQTFQQNQNKTVYVIDSETGELLNEIDRKLWKYYYMPKLSEDLQPNLYFDEEKY